MRLQAFQKPRIENKAFQLDPSIFEPDLDPTVQNAVRRDAVDDFGHDTPLQSLVDREAVQTAWDFQSAQQCHQQDGLGIALPIAVSKDSRGRNIVCPIVAEGDIVSYEVIGRTNALERRQHGPSSCGKKCLYAARAIIQQRRFRQISLHLFASMNAASITCDNG